MDNIEALIERKKAAAFRFYDLSMQDRAYFFKKNTYAKDRLLETERRISEKDILDYLVNKSLDKRRVTNSKINDEDLDFSSLSQESYRLYKQSMKGHEDAINYIQKDIAKVESHICSTRYKNIDKGLYDKPLTVLNSIPTSQVEQEPTEATQGTKRSFTSYNDTQTQAGESSSSFKRPRNGNSPILDEVYKGGDSPFKKEVRSTQVGESSINFPTKIPQSESKSIRGTVSGNSPASSESNLQIPNCEPDAPYKMKFANIDFVLPRSIKVPYLGIDFVIPTIKVPVIEIDIFISCLIDLPINYNEILYISVRMIIAAIPIIIANNPW